MSVRDEIKVLLLELFKKYPEERVLLEKIYRLLMKNEDEWSKPPK